MVTPSRQRAAALRLAHSARMLSQGLTLWPSPDILPWGAWVERELEQARVHGESLPRRLSAAEQWQLWREALLQAAAGLDMLAPERLIDPMRRAVALLEDHGLQLSASASPEAALLSATRAGYQRRCRELGALGSESWLECAPFLHPSSRLMLVGFGALGSARRQWLERQGARICDALEPDAEEWPACEPQVCAQPAPAAEAQAAADWCADWLRRDPAARLLLVVPRLAAQRHHWLRALSQRLDPLRILGVAEAALERPPFAVEGGRALAEHPLVRTALELISLGAGRVDVETLGALLRSPYLAEADAGARLQLELWLRERGLDPPTLEGLVRQREAIARDAGPAAAALVQALQQALQEPAEAASSAGSSAIWAAVFADWLERCGWPGQSLGSDEQQVQLRFSELLGELAALEVPGRSLSPTGALQLLHERARREHFEPASDDVAVTVTASLDDPIVRYDGIWVAGLSADAWPAPVQTDPLIPAGLQRQAGLPGSSAALQLERARELQGLWARRARSLVLSWAATEEDLPTDPSPLLQGLPPLAPAAPPAHFQLADWLAGLEVPLQRWQELRGPAWAGGQELRGGARLLELQSLCPFRGHAELRLEACELGAAEHGLAARERGRMLHRALELLWRALGSQQALHGEPAALLALAQRCAAQAVQELSPGAAGPLLSLLLAREVERMRALLTRLIDWERTREPFAPRALEYPTHLALAGHRLPLRLDRIDRLQDGRLLVLDYKSGRPLPFDAHDERPVQPQLAAYALALGAEVAAVAMLYFGGPTLAVRGVADRPGRLPRLRGLPAGLDWQVVQEQWRERLDTLAQEFIDGHAAVEPQPGACERCHLQMLCRIDPLGLEALRTVAETQSEITAAQGAVNAAEDAGD